MGQSSMRSGVLVAGYRTVYTSHKGHLLAMGVSSGRTLLKLTSLSRIGIYSISHIHNSIVAFADSPGFRFFHLERNAEIHSIPVPDLSFRGITYLKRPSFVAAIQDLRLWRMSNLNSDEPIESSFVCKLDIAENPCNRCAGFDEVALPNLLVTGSARQDKSVSSADSWVCGAIWDLTERRQMATLSGHRGTVNTIQVDASRGRGIVTGSDDKSIRIWGIQSREETACRIVSERIQSLICPRDRPHSIVAAGRDSILLLDHRRFEEDVEKWETGAEDHYRTPSIVTKLSEIDGERFGVVVNYPGKVSVRSLRGGKILSEKRLQGRGWSVCYFPPYGEFGGDV